MKYYEYCFILPYALYVLTRAILEHNLRIRKTGSIELTHIKAQTAKRQRKKRLQCRSSGR